MELWMPSTSFHIRREHLEHLDAVADEHEQLNNPSQALKWILDDHMENNE